MAEGARSYELRRGGRVRLVDDSLFLERPGEDQVVRVALEDVVEVTRRDLDLFVGVLAVVVVGLGTAVLPRSVPGGLALVGVGLASGYRTYRRRDEVKIRVTGRTRPLTLYPVDAAALCEALEATPAAGAAKD